MRHFALLLALGTAACGTSGSSSPLVGTWGSSSCGDPAAGSDDVAPCSGALTFGSDGSYTSTGTGVVAPTAAINVGCTETTTSTGLEWVATATTVQVVDPNQTAEQSIKRTGCTNPADNIPSPKPTRNDDAVWQTPLPFTVSGNTLTIGAPDGPGGFVLVLTRQ